MDYSPFDILRMSRCNTGDDTLAGDAALPPPRGGAAAAAVAVRTPPFPLPYVEDDPGKNAFPEVYFAASSSGWGGKSSIEKMAIAGWEEKQGNARPSGILPLHSTDTGFGVAQAIR